jgi:hypothetical protein
MDVVRAAEHDKKEKLTKLSELKPGCGKAFRFQGTSYAEGLANTDDACFYMVIKSGAEKTGRVAICSVDGKIVRECDDTHLVIAHAAKFVVSDPEMV